MSIMPQLKYPDEMNNNNHSHSRGNRTTITIDDNFGGNEIDSVQNVDAGAYFIFQNQYGWRIRPSEESQTIGVIGSIVPADPSLSITTPTLGGFTVMFNGLQPITTIANTVTGSAVTEADFVRINAENIAATPTADEIAEAIINKDVP